MGIQRNVEPILSHTAVTTSYLNDLHELKMTASKLLKARWDLQQDPLNDDDRDAVYGIIDTFLEVGIQRRRLFETEAATQVTVYVTRDASRLDLDDGHDDDVGDNTVGSHQGDVMEDV